jgi:hypothetical protein
MVYGFIHEYLNILDQRTNRFLAVVLFDQKIYKRVIEVQIY